MISDVDPPTHVFRLFSARRSSAKSTIEPIRFESALNATARSTAFSGPARGDRRSARKPLNQGFYSGGSMNWLETIWIGLSAASLALGVVHLFVWFEQKSQVAHLLFFALAASATAFGAFELTMMHSPSPVAYAATLRWAHVPLAMSVLSVVWFVHFHFDAGRLWLAWAATGLRLLALALNFGTGVNINFSEVSALDPLTLWGGVVVAGPVGSANPMAVVPQIGNLLLACVCHRRLHHAVAPRRRRCTSSRDCGRRRRRGLRHRGLRLRRVDHTGFVRSHRTVARHGIALGHLPCDPGFGRRPRSGKPCAARCRTRAQHRDLRDRPVVRRAEGRRRMRRPEPVADFVRPQRRGGGPLALGRRDRARRLRGVCAAAARPRRRRRKRGRDRTLTHRR